MKRLGITQRVEVVADYGERRDCLDQRWHQLVPQLGYLPLPLPNINPGDVPLLLDNLELDGVLFSGGNSIGQFAPDADDVAPERDAFETKLLKECLARHISVIGVCRGMQLINTVLGGSLEPIDSHVAKHHRIYACSAAQFANRVNSYHNWAIPAAGLADKLSPLATDMAGNIEAFEAMDQKILGVMWHPEREAPFCSLDIKLIKKYLP